VFQVFEVLMVHQVQKVTLVPKEKSVHQVSKVTQVLWVFTVLKVH
jgi:hypothetical protein